MNTALTEKAAEAAVVRECAGPRTPTDAQMVKAAQAKFIHEEGNIEVDDGAAVSRGDGNSERGAYVQAWVWVYDSSVPGFEDTEEGE